MRTETSRRPPIGGVLLLIGGALSAIGSFLTWADVTVADVTASAKGVDGSDGYLTLIGGIVLIGTGIAALRSPRRVVAIVGIVAGLVVTGVGIYDAVTAEDSVLDAVAEDIAPTLGASVAEVRDVLQGSADAGDLEVTLQVGLFLVIGGGVLGAVGGVIAAATAKRDALARAPSMPATAASPTMGDPAWTPTAERPNEDLPDEDRAPPSAAPPPPPPGTPAE